MGRHEKIATVRLGAPRRSRERGPSRFTQGDVSRAIRAVLREKIEIAAIRIEPDGTILIIPGTPAFVAQAEANPWDA